MFRYKFIVGFLFVLLIWPMHALAQGGEPPIPAAPTGGNVVLDTLDWLTPAQEKEVNDLNQKLDSDGIAQLAVVTLNDCGDDKQKFRNDLFRTWGIGHANDNDGLLILVCWYGGDQSRRSVEQETGYGLEGTLPDVLTGRVVDEEFIPAFQSNHAGDGLVNMVRRYDNLLRKNTTVAKTDSSFILNLKQALVLLGLLGTLPGIILAITYSSFLNIRNGLAGTMNTNMDMPSVFEEETTRKARAPWLYRFAMAEILALLPILALLFLIQQNILQVSVTILDYSRFLFPLLAVWLAILILGYASKFFPSTNWPSNQTTQGDRWESQNNQQPSPTTDLLDTLSDIAKDLPSFGGGDSGGGGSSKNF